MATDPVCQMKVDESTAFSATFHGKPYYFCSENCRQRFLRRQRTPDGQHHKPSPDDLGAPGGGEARQDTASPCCADMPDQDLQGIGKAIRLSRQVVRNIRQNLFFAFVYNSLGIPIAAGVFYPLFGILLSPIIAAAAMSFSSVSVVSNALRLNTTTL